MCEFNICVLYIWKLKGPNDLLKEEFILLYIYKNIYREIDSCIFKTAHFYTFIFYICK